MILVSLSLCATSQSGSFTEGVYKSKQWEPLSVFTATIFSDMSSTTLQINNKITELPNNNWNFNLYTGEFNPEKLCVLYPPALYGSLSPLEKMMLLPKFPSTDFMSWRLIL